MTITIGLDPIACEGPEVARLSALAVGAAGVHLVVSHPGQASASVAAGGLPAPGDARCRGWQDGKRMQQPLEKMMNERRAIAPNEDPVCGMTVEPDVARAKGLATSVEGAEFVFCGKGCLLEFRDAPETFLDPGYVAAM